MSKRNILFRYWDGQTMHTNGAFQFEQFATALYGEQARFAFFPFEGMESDQMVCGDAHTCGVLMQWTGLLDKDGIGIYEGDIMQFSEGIAKVIWDDAAFALQSPGSQAVDYEPSSVFETGKVIGNIYEHPELFDI